MNVKDVEKLIRLMEEHGLSEIEIEDDKGKVRLAKQGDAAREIISMPAVQVAQGGGSPVNTDETAKQPEDTAENVICSPLVGTFYRKSAPESEPFVKVGDAVDEETVVCVIEAMKIMNEVKAEKKGVIREILVEDGHPVEYMQPIFRVE